MASSMVMVSEGRIVDLAGWAGKMPIEFMGTSSFDVSSWGISEQPVPIIKRRLTIELIKRAGRVFTGVLLVKYGNLVSYGGSFAAGNCS